MAGIADSERTIAGRPASHKAKDVRHELLEASRRLFASHGYAGVSIKSIADHAKVNPAMVHYYFGNKEGLFSAVIEETLQPVLEKVRELENLEETELFIEQFLAVYMETIAANPWFPVLLTREVILPEGRLKANFIKQVVKPVSNKIRKLIDTQKKRNELHDFVDPELATINLISLAVFPFLAMPVIGKAMDVELSDAFVEKLSRHTAHLYLEGITSPGH